MSPFPLAGSNSPSATPSVQPASVAFIIWPGMEEDVTLSPWRTGPFSRLILAGVLPAIVTGSSLLFMGSFNILVSPNRATMPTALVSYWVEDFVTAKV